MSTISKFYLHATTTGNGGTLPAGTASVSATSPTKIASGTNRSMNATIGTSQTSIALTTNAVTSNQSSMIGRWISDPIGAQTISSQTITVHCGESESNSNSNFNVSYVLAVWRPSNGSVVGRIYDLNAALSPAAGTSETDTSISTSTGVSSVTASQGDVLVIELWRNSTVQGMGTSYTNTIFYDGTTEASASTNAAYVNFANAITMGDVPSVSDSGSFSTTESISIEVDVSPTDSGSFSTDDFVINPVLWDDFNRVEQPIIYPWTYMDNRTNLASTSINRLDGSTMTVGTGSPITGSMASIVEIEKDQYISATWSAGIAPTIFLRVSTPSEAAVDANANCYKIVYNASFHQITIYKEIEGTETLVAFATDSYSGWNSVALHMDAFIYRSTIYVQVRPEASFGSAALLRITDSSITSGNHIGVYFFNGSMDYVYASKINDVQKIINQDGLLMHNALPGPSWRKNFTNRQSALLDITPFSTGGTTTPISDSDSGTFSVTEAISVQVQTSPTDSGSFSTADAVAVEVDVAVTDSGSTSVTEADVSVQNGGQISVQIAKPGITWKRHFQHRQSDMLDTGMVPTNLSISDSGAFSTTEAQSVEVDVAVTDSGSFSTTEAISIQVSFGVTDSGGFSTTDVIAVEVDTSVSDSGSFSTSDAITNIEADVSVTDSGSFSTTEVVAIEVDIATSDSGSISVTEGDVAVQNGGQIGIQIAKPGITWKRQFQHKQSDMLSVGMVPTNISDSDSGAFSTAESQSIEVDVAVTDSGSFSTNESASIASTSSVSDSGAFSATEAISVEVDISVTDSGSFSTTESAVTAIPYAVSDSGTFSITEAIAIQVQVSPTDSGSFSTSDVVAVEVDAAVSDSGSFSTTDAITSVEVDVSVSDSGSTSVNEVLAVDTGAPHIMPYASPGRTWINRFLNRQIPNPPAIINIIPQNVTDSGTVSLGGGTVTPNIRGKQTAAADNSVTFNYSGYDVAPQAGDKLVVFVVANGYSYSFDYGFSNIAVGSGTGWSRPVYVGIGAEGAMAIFTRDATGNTSDNVRIDGTTTDGPARMAAVAITVANVASVSFGTTSQTIGSGNGTAPSLGSAGDLLVDVFAAIYEMSHAVIDPSIPGGMTNVAVSDTSGYDLNINPSTIRVVSEILGTPGTRTSDFGTWSGERWAEAVAFTGTSGSGEAVAVEVDTSITDSGSFSTSESISIKSQISVSDSGSFSTSDSAAVQVNISVSDSGTFSTTESAAPSVSFTVTDSGSVSITESISIEVDISTSDSGSFSTTESATAQVSFSVADSGSFSTTESVAPQVQTSVTDSGSFSTVESVSVEVDLAITDSGTVSITEDLAIEVDVSDSDSGAFSVQESIYNDQSLGVTIWPIRPGQTWRKHFTGRQLKYTPFQQVSLISDSDSGSFSTTEAVNVEVDVAVTDSGTFSTTDSVAPEVDVSVTDNGTFSTTESTSPQIQVSVIDSGSTSVVESISIQVQVAVSDSGSFSTSESSTSEVDISVTDSGSFSTIESAITAISFSVSDSGSFSTTEASGVQIQVPVTDSGTFSASESATLQVQISVSDSGSFSTTEGVDISEAASISTSDSGSVSVSEAVAVQVNVSPTDSGSFSTVEDMTGTGYVSVSDSGTISVTESVNVPGSTNVNDSGTVSVTEAISISVQFSVSDSGSVSTAESISPAAGILVTDIGTASVTEAFTSLGAMSIADSGSISATAVQTVGIQVTLSDSGSVSVVETATQIIAGAMSDSGTISVTESISIDIINIVMEEKSFYPASTDGSAVDVDGDGTMGISVDGLSF